MTGGSDGGGGHTSESIMSSVTRIMPTRSGGSVRDELKETETVREIDNEYVVEYIEIRGNAV